MVGQMEIDEYLKTLEVKGFDILDYIPVGQDNAITRAALAKQTNISDRVLRQLIHDARRKIPILNMQDGNGYFIPDMNKREDVLLLKNWVNQEMSRLKSTGWAITTARRTLSNCGIDWRNYDEQQTKGQRRRARACKSA